MNRWPEWWEWEIVLPPYVMKRMADRDFSEVELRRMFADARSYRPNVIGDRWVIETRHQDRAWEVIVEPDGLKRRLIIVTAYPIGLTMQERFLEVTFRDGRALAAYLYLPRTPGLKSVRTEQFGKGIIVDYDSNEAPMGVEITEPELTSVDDINRVLDRLNQPRLGPDELAPLVAA